MKKFEDYEIFDAVGTDKEHQASVHQAAEKRMAELVAEGKWTQVRMWDWSDHWTLTYWRTPTLEELQ